MMRSYRIAIAARVIALMLAAGTAFAGRPLTVDDAGTVAPGDCELEAGFLTHHDSNARNYQIPFGLTAGLFPTLEAGLGFGSQIEERLEDVGRETVSGIGDLALGAKWNPLSEEQFWAAHAVAFSVKLPTASQGDGLGTGEVDADLTYIASKSLGQGWSAHLNAGFTWTGDPDGAPEHDLFHAGMAAGWSVSGRVELLAEIVANTSSGHSDDTTVEGNVGMRWSVRNNLVLDAAIGTRLRGDAPDLTATLGLTWTLSLNRKTEAN